MTYPPPLRVSKKIGLLTFLLVATLSAAGCGLFGPDFDKNDVPTAKYSTLAGQTCAVMVYADPVTLIDYPTLREDIGTDLQRRITDEGRDYLKRPELAGTSFPYPATSLVRFQKDHETSQSEPIDKLALRLDIPNLTRLIYVEVQEFQTRYQNTPNLFRGEARVSLSVVEIKDNVAKIAFREDNISVNFPENDEEAVPASDTVNDNSVKDATVALIGSALARRFFDEDAK